MAISYTSSPEQTDKLKKLADSIRAKIPAGTSRTQATAAPAASSEEPEAPVQRGSVSINPSGGGRQSSGAGSSTPSSIHVSPSGGINRKNISSRMSEAGSEHEKRLRDLFSDKRIDTKNSLYSMEAQRSMNQAVEKRRWTPENLSSEAAYRAVKRGGPQLTAELRFMQARPNDYYGGGMSDLIRRRVNAAVNS